MRARFGVLRALAMGLLFAVVGFTFALVTSSASSNKVGLGSRAVGTANPLRFTNPLVQSLPGEYDLGDALFGSVDGRLITRYCTAEGGLKPYRFTSEGLLSLDRVLAGTLHSLQLGLSGALVGTMPYTLPPSITTITGAPGFRFQVTLRDSQGTGGTTTTGFFNVFLFNGGAGFFKFANDRLSSARVGLPYSSHIDLLGGTPPYTFTVSSITGGSSSNLSDLGLFITNDGTIMGVPLAQGSFTITVHAVDSKGAIANNRANTAPDQSLILSVGANSISSSDLTTLSCSVRGDRAGGGKDNLRYVGVVNALGQDKFSLADSDFAFRLANIAVTGRLDSKGSFKGDLADGSSAKVKISSSGILSVMISKGSFATALNAATLVDGKLTREILQVTVGDAVVSSEALDFDTSVRDTRYGLNYSLGRNGDSAGGGFQIVSVKGKDDLSSGGLTGDSWRVGFIALSPMGITANGTPGLDNVTAVNIRIGTNFIQNLTPIKSRGNNTRFSLKTPDGVTRFSLNGKNGKGTLQTDTLATRVTGIPQAIAASGFGNLFFPLGVDITRTGAPFTGEHARRIFGLGKNYKDQAPKR